MILEGHDLEIAIIFEDVDAEANEHIFETKIDIVGDVARFDLWLLQYIPTCEKVDHVRVTRVNCVRVHDLNLESSAPRGRLKLVGQEHLTVRKRDLRDNLSLTHDRNGGAVCLPGCGVLMLETHVEGQVPQLLKVARLCGFCSNN